MKTMLKIGLATIVIATLLSGCDTTTTCSKPKTVGFYNTQKPAGFYR